MKLPPVRSVPEDELLGGSSKENTPLRLDTEFLNDNGTFPSRKNGLSSEEAKRRLAEYGPNTLETSSKEPFWRILLTQSRNVIFMLTSIAALISFATGDDIKGWVLVAIVVFVCGSNAIGEYTGQDAGDALKRMAAAKATVIRDGEEKSVPSEDVVIGDVVLVKAGDVVPADMVLLQCTDLQTNESMLTGEAKEQNKTIHSVGDKESVFLPNMVYKETFVVAGHGKAEVIATGMETQVGQIAEKLDVGKAEVNPLQRSINRLGYLLGFACIAMLVSATAISYFTGYQNPMTPCADDDGHCLMMSSLLRGLLMAVSLIPHGLPLVVMVMLRVGKKEMYKQNAMVTKVSAVDYLGAAQVICTDKTGTLTEGKMTAKAVYGICRQSAESSQMEPVSLTFHPLRGFCPSGGLFKDEDLTQELRGCLDAQLNTGHKGQRFKDLREVADLANPEEVLRPGATADALIARVQLACAFLGCYELKLEQDAKGHWTAVGNMTEAALKVAAAKGGYWEEDGLGASLRQKHARVSDLEITFSGSRKMSCTIHALPTDQRLQTLQFEKEVTHVALLKGAPDKIITRLRAVLLLQDSCLRVLCGQLSQESRAALERENERLSSCALRTILMAVCPLKSSEVDALHQAADADARLQLLLASESLCFLGLWGIYDPPRSAVPASVRECHEAGIRVVMITGDQHTTGVAIAKSVGILNDEITGDSNCTALHIQTMKLPDKISTPGNISFDANLRVEEIKKNSPLLQQRVLTKTSSSLGTGTTSSMSFGSFYKPATPLSPEAPFTPFALKTPADAQRPDYLDQDYIAELTRTTHVWSRAQPRDKVEIVTSLKDQGNVTAMTGDGVNDAPALKKAGVGVAMGISGTEVAKSASDLVLLDDNFTTIVSAIREGRRIYVNTQKYVTFNLSVKSSECLCLMLSIMIGTPMPIRGLQLLTNLVCTHIIPTMSLAWEPPEPYVMHTPPRKTEGDLVVSRLQLLYRWIPFLICMPITVIGCLSVGVWSHTGFFHGNSLIGTSRVGWVAQGLVACEYAGRLGVDKEFVEDVTPFHCRCNVHQGGVPWAEVEQVDQWGRKVPASMLDSAFDRWSGSTGKLYDQEFTPWRDGTRSLLDPCKDRNGIERWCWRDDTPAELPLLPVGLHCAAYGTQLGQSMAYVSIHLGEILSLMSFRMDSFFLMQALSNPVYTALFLFNILALVVSIYVPHISGVLLLAPLSPGRFLLAACFAFLLMLLNELAKVIFRMKQGSHNQKLRNEALMTSQSGRRREDIV